MGSLALQLFAHMPPGFVGFVAHGFNSGNCRAILRNATVNIAFVVSRAAL